MIEDAPVFRSLLSRRASAATSVRLARHSKAARRRQLFETLEARVVLDADGVAPFNAQLELTSDTETGTFVVGQPVEFHASAQAPNASDEVSFIWRVYQDDQTDPMGIPFFFDPETDDLVDTSTLLGFEVMNDPEADPPLFLRASDFSFTATSGGTYFVVVTPIDQDFEAADPLEYMIDVEESGSGPHTIDASFTASLPQEEGSAITLTASASYTGDPSTELHYSWIITRDGAIYDVGSGSSFQFTPDNEGDYEVTLLVDDSADAFDLVIDTISVDNVAPSFASITGPSSVLRGTVAEFAVVATDPGVNDTVSISWTLTDSNNVVVASGTGTSIQIDETGDYTLQFTADDGLASTQSAPISISAGAAAVVDGELIVTTSPSGSNVTIEAGSIIVTVDGHTQTFEETVDIIRVFGSDGDDTIVVGSGVSVPLWITGGKGNDLIIGGSGADIIDGGEGNDIIAGGAGRDLLIGGDGHDLIVGDAGDDVIIAGTTSLSDTALAAAREVWLGSGSFAARASALSAHINSSNTQDDDDLDLLFGDSGNDLFFANLLLNSGESLLELDLPLDITLAELLLLRDLQ